MLSQNSALFTMFYKSLIKFGNVFWVIQITQIKEKVEFLRYITEKN